jgi:hypothetical protein
MPSAAFTTPGQLHALHAVITDLLSRQQQIHSHAADITDAFTESSLYYLMPPLQMH